MNQVKILSTLRHPHLVALFGCTSRRSHDLLLVYEYVPNGTVADHLHGHLSAISPLPWRVQLRRGVDISRHRHETNLSTLAVNKILNHPLHELVDPKLGCGSDAGVTTMIKLVPELAFRCLQEDTDGRPSMEEVLVELRNIEKVGSSMLDKEEINIFEDQLVDHHSKDENLHESMIKWSVTRSLDSVMEKWVSKSTTPKSCSC